MSDQQAKTIELYGHLMQINASSHVLRTARSVGIIEELREGQRTLDELCQARFLHREATELLLDALVTIGVVEKYGDDYAISQAARLLNQYDKDLGDEFWGGLPDLLLGKTLREDSDNRALENRDTATQWTQTAAAIQAAEILDIGGETSPAGIRILDIGCGAAVWSCAMAHRDQASTVLAIDHAESSLAATNTADSIELAERFEFRESDLSDPDLPAGEFDLVVIARRLHYLSNDDAAKMLAAASAAAKSGGRVVVIDLFRVPSRKTLTETIEALKLELGTAEGSMRTLKDGQDMMATAGLQDVQFTFIAASRAGLGMCVGKKP